MSCADCGMNHCVCDLDILDVYEDTCGECFSNDIEQTWNEVTPDQTRLVGYKCTDCDHEWAVEWEEE